MQLPTIATILALSALVAASPAVAPGKQICSPRCAEDEICIVTDDSTVCVVPEFCGGIAGFPCDDGKICIDDPRDSCDPLNGGADCGGICV